MASSVRTVRQPHAMMATPAEEKQRLWKKIDDVEEEKKEVKAELKNAVGAEKERLLQERLIKLEEQLAGYATAIGKLPAAPGML